MTMQELRRNRAKNRTAVYRISREISGSHVPNPATGNSAGFLRSFAACLSRRRGNAAGRLSEAAIEQLATLPNLKKLSIASGDVSPGFGDALREKHPDKQVFISKPRNEQSRYQLGSGQAWDSSSQAKKRSEAAGT